MLPIHATDDETMIIEGCYLYSKYNRQLSFLLLAILIVTLLVGCAIAPVQEMSDARQAVEAARTAGAAKIAKQNFKNSERFLLKAEEELENGNYEDARKHATAARQEAIVARKKTLKKSNLQDK